MNKILFVTLSISLSISFLFALEKENITSAMTSKIEKTTQILLDKSSTKEQKSKKVFPLFDNVFDYELMAKLSLGKKNWLSFNSAQQQEFIEKFLFYLKKTYMNQMNLYSGEEVRIIETKDINPKRTYLITELVGEKENYEIIYKFYTSNEDWKIYDLDILGVSLIQTYRAQFDDILSQGDFKTLISKLEIQAE